VRGTTDVDERARRSQDRARDEGGGDEDDRHRIRKGHPHDAAFARDVAMAGDFSCSARMSSAIPSRAPVILRKRVAASEFMAISA
jgi:hypothetical protein